MPRKPQYTTAELALLRQLYPNAPQADVQEALPGRRWGTLARKANMLGIVRTHRLPSEWTPAEAEMVRQHYPTGGPQAVLAHLARSVTRAAIHGRARRLGVTRTYGKRAYKTRTTRATYTAQELAAITELFPRASMEVLLAALPGRNFKAIHRQARKLGLNRFAIHWPPADDAYLVAHYAQDGPAAVAQALGRTARQVISHAHKLGVRFLPVSVPKAPKPPRPEKQAKAPKPEKVLKAAKAPKPAKAVKAKVAKPVSIAKPAKVAAPKPAKVLKAEPDKRPLPVPGVQSNFRTPILNAAKAARIASEKQQKQAKALQQIVPAAEVQKLAYTHPARMAYMLNAKHGGMAASVAFREVMQQQKGGAPC